MSPQVHFIFQADAPIVARPQALNQASSCGVCQSFGTWFRSSCRLAGLPLFPAGRWNV